MKKLQAVSCMLQAMAILPGKFFITRVA